MPDDQFGPDRMQDSPVGPHLLQRVRTRLARVQRVLERRDASAEPTTGTRTPAQSKTPELRALNAVYHGLARTHRQHRKLSGERASPALRAAARAFRQEPSVFLLTIVAGHLDDRGLLKW